VRIIDSDIHPLTTDGLAAIFPYLSAGWRRRLDPLSGWSSAARLGSTRPAGGLQDARNVTPWAARGDALPPSGGAPGSDAGFVIEHHLNGHSNIEVAVLNPIQPLWVDAFVNSEDAATVVSGFNDYFASEWLPRDDRFRLTMTVAPQDAVTAAAEIRRFGDTPGVVAVSFPIMNALLGDPRFYPIYEAAQELGLDLGAQHAVEDGRHVEVRAPVDTVGEALTHPDCARSDSVHYPACCRDSTRRPSVSRIGDVLGRSPAAVQLGLPSLGR
jgi:hypothetical protein